MSATINVFWFRRDLRLEDNAGLFHALNAGLPVLPVFIFDSNILDQLEDRSDRRVAFIDHALRDMQQQLEKMNSTLDVRHGNPLQVMEELVNAYEIGAVFTNHDYEPYARQRDEEIKDLLRNRSIGFFTYKDQVIFEKDEVAKEDGCPYMIFTPYAKRWRSLLKQEHHAPYYTNKMPGQFLAQKPRDFPSLEAMGFAPTQDVPQKSPLEEAIVRQYDQTRNIPAIKGTSRMGIHLRFGTVSIRQLVRRAQELNEVFLNELIWREFFMQLLWHRPDVVNSPCKKEYEGIPWRNREDEFFRWCAGQTGYPIVDAGMRELNATGFMHNRVRMITASFLVKHLLIDWRWGEAYFAEKLVDYELASNNGNWQWVAGCGCDAAPYFRMFNPHTQTKRFDPKLEYIRKWVPKLDEFSYPGPIVPHEYARERCLKAYKTALAAARSY